MARLQQGGFALALSLFLVGMPLTPRAPADEEGRRWLFAEGTTLPGWETWLALLNPGDVAATVRVHWIVEEGPAPPPTDVAVAPGSRRTLDVGQAAGAGHVGVAMVVEASVPVVAERPVYLSAHVPGLGEVVGAHVAAGTTSPRSTWLFAEGTTLPGFRQYLTLLNPGSDPATVSISYALEGDQPPLVRTLGLPPGARRTVDVAAAGEGALGMEVPGVAVTIDAGSVPIVVERPVYIARPFGGRGVVIGASIGAPATAPAEEWTFAEGTTLDTFVQYLSVLNPGPRPSSVSVEYRLENGIVATRVCGVAGRSRLTIAVFDPTGPCGLGRDVANGTLGEGVAVTVRAGAGVVVERPMYFVLDGSGGRSTGAHSALGFPGDLPAEHLFAEGTTRQGFRTWWTVMNPHPTDLVVMVSYFFDPGGRLDQAITVPPGARATVDAETHVGPGRDFAARLSSGDGRGFAVERPLYRDIGDGHVGVGTTLVQPATATDTATVGKAAG